MKSVFLIVTKSRSDTTSQCSAPGGGGGGGALRVKISRGAPLEVQNGTQHDLNKMIDLVNLGGKKSVYMLKMWSFEMGPNKIWIKW